MSFAFPKSARLSRRADYQRVFIRPQRSSDRYFTVLARPSGQAARLGLAIAKKQVKRATARNRLKRLIRESFRHHQKLLYGLDIVVMVKSGCDRASNSVLLASLSHHWQVLHQLTAQE